MTPCRGSQVNPAGHVTILAPAGETRCWPCRRAFKAEAEQWTRTPYALSSPTERVLRQAEAVLGAELADGV